MTQRPSRRILLPADEAQVVALYEAGCSVRAIAAEFGVSASPIYSALMRHGVTRRSTNNPRGRARADAKKPARCDRLGRIILNQPRNARARSRSLEKAGR